MTIAHNCLIPKRGRKRQRSVTICNVRRLAPQMQRDLLALAEAAFAAIDRERQPPKKGSPC